jgi:hypothetical protein
MSESPKPYVVYTHSHKGEVFYVGSGVRRRPFLRAAARHPLWHNYVYEIRRRAERQAARLYDASEKAKARGSNQYEERSQDRTSPLSLSDHGVSKQQMSDWRKLARVPDQDFDAAFAKGARGNSSNQYHKEV